METWSVNDKVCDLNWCVRAADNASKQKIHHAGCDKVPENQMHHVHVSHSVVRKSSSSSTPPSSTMVIMVHYHHRHHYLHHNHHHYHHHHLHHHCHHHYQYSPSSPSSLSLSTLTSSPSISSFNLFAHANMNPAAAVLFVCFLQDGHKHRLFWVVAQHLQLEWESLYELLPVGRRRGSRLHRLHLAAEKMS